MTGRLVLLDGVRWDGEPLPGERLGALLAALALRPTGVSDEVLVEEVWEDDPPANPVKALQVLVSRVRARCGADAVVRHEGGYRLGLQDVDARELAEAVGAARAARAGGDAAGALAVLEPVAAGLTGPAVDAADTPAPLAELRRRADRDRSGAAALRGVALSRLGRHAEALPLLVSAHAARRDDGDLLAALLRSEAAVGGPAAALGRYEAYRADLADRLGVDPAPALQRLHRELLAADDPVRTGLRYDAGGLLGREGDLQRLRAALAGSRLVTVLGPGGIGKTSIAQVLARESQLPRVHVVELVGVGSGDDVVAEVGTALGVRGSVTSRRALTPAQQADVRGRIAQELDGSPTLLVLDNCEHVLEPVAGLVAFLLVTARDLQVLATSRAPLRIAAEQVVPLTQLAADDAADLFGRRALAVRPDLELDPDMVAAVVDRLDGLPLAIELAAARTRTMSVAEIRDALGDRFGLLRSRDRTGPERHRTLTAVIAWSWGLLTDEERAAAARLSVFHDGFDAAAARAVLGRGSTEDALDLVEALADQSLVTVTEERGRTRFRMLETIREYAAARLAESGDQDAALAAQDAWGLALVGTHGSLFFAADQLGSVDALLAEENNLTDVLRRALGRGDGRVGVRLLSSLGSLWTITGNHPRFFAVADAAQELLTEWTPGEDEVEVSFEAAALLLVHLGWVPGRDTAELRRTMAGWGEPQHPWARVAQTMFLDDHGGVVERILALAEGETDPTQAGMLLLWAAINAENVGDIDGATAHAERALALGPSTPYLQATLHAELSQLSMHRGDHRVAARHASAAWPALLRLHALDDGSGLLLTTAMAMLLDGDLEGCARTLEQVDSLPEAGQLGSRMMLEAARAELALAQGDTETGLARYDRAVEGVTIDVPGWSGLSPWLLIAASAALTARVRHGGPGPDRRAEELRALLLGRNVPGSDGAGHVPVDDLPLSGVLLVAVAAHQLRYGDPSTYDDALRLLAVARRWSYNRAVPSLAWEPLAAMADAARPGRLAELLAEVADRPGPDLAPEARALLAGLPDLPRAGLTSGG